MTKNLHKDIQHHLRALPPLPTAVARLLRLTSQPDVDLSEIIHTVSLDQALTARVLRIANSAFYGFSQQIRTVQQAVVVLGKYAVRNIALSMAVSDLHGSLRHDEVLDHVAFWRHSVGVACGAFRLAKALDLPHSDDAFVVGLLHDVGKMVLAAHLESDYVALLAQAEARSLPLYAHERDVLGIDHAAVGAQLCQFWNLPEVLRDAVAAHHTSNSAEATPLAFLVRTANTLAKLAAIGDSGSPILDDWSALPPAYAAKLPSLLHALPGEIGQMENILFESAPPLDAQASPRAPASLRLPVPSPEHYQYLALALCARGYEPGSDLHDAAVLTACSVTLDGAEDEPTTCATLDLNSAPLPVITGTSINTRHLHAWLDQVLTSSSPEMP